MNKELSRVISQLPAFSQIKAAMVKHKITDLLAQNQAALDRLASQDEAVSWDNFVLPFDEVNDRLQRSWSPLRHLHGVADTEELRTAYNDVLPHVSKYNTDLLQNDGLFRGYKALRGSVSYNQLSASRRRVVDNALRDFRLGGIELDGEHRTRFGEIQQTLAQLGARFEENVLDATQAWDYHTENPGELRGLPESTLALAAQNARGRDQSGWLLTLDMPCYLPTMMYAENRELRRVMYEAYATRASDQGPHAGKFDNTDTMQRMLALRQEMAGLLGYGNYAELSLATKMAKSTDEVLGFLHDLTLKSRPQAQKEHEELERFARANTKLDRLEAWDVAFFSEKLRQHAYDISQEQLRPYFPADRVLSGLFAIVKRLFGMTVEPVDPVDTWHPDVQFFQIRDHDDQLRGMFYLDLYARAGKRGGAWMDECIVRRRTTDGIQYPVAYLTCNFTPPVASQPSLLTHDEVVTLFHECGHGLHHMLTRVEDAQVSGINGVAWDAVELPSQFLENWCWEREALDLLSSHHETGAPLSPDLFGKLLAAKNFQAGMKLARQLEFALFDFRLHREYRPGLDIQALLNEVRHQVAVVIPPAYNRFQHGFSHIFSGGYAAGYYSYKWAEVLSADAFSRFTEEGIFNPATGQDFLKHILEAGGTDDALTLFMAFRRREPRIDALLRRSGLSS